MTDTFINEPPMSQVKIKSLTNRIQYEDFIMPYGKYEGYRIKDIYQFDADYIFWLLDHSNGDIKKAVECTIEKEAIECSENTQKMKKLKKCFLGLKKNIRKKV